MKGTGSLPVIVGMATMPTRAGSLPLALENLLPQADRIYLYLDGHAEVPTIARRNPRIIPLFRGKTPHVHGAGKFLGLLHETSPCFYAGVDDDILYPEDYLATLRGALARAELPTVVGYHGVVLHETVESYRRDRQVFAFKDALTEASPVDVLGSGTVMFLTADLKFDVTAWPETNITDLQLAMEARRAGMAMRCLPRAANYLQPIAVQQADSIYTKLLKDDSRQTQLAQTLQALGRVRHYCGPA